MSELQQFVGVTQKNVASKLCSETVLPLRDVFQNLLFQNKEHHILVLIHLGLDFFP